MVTIEQLDQLRHEALLLKRLLIRAKKLGVNSKWAAKLWLLIREQELKLQDHIQKSNLC